MLQRLHELQASGRYTHSGWSTHILTIEQELMRTSLARQHSQPGSSLNSLTALEPAFLPEDPQLVTCACRRVRALFLFPVRVHTWG